MVAPLGGTLLTLSLPPPFSLRRQPAEFFYLDIPHWALPTQGTTHSFISPHPRRSMHAPHILHSPDIPCILHKQEISLILHNPDIPCILHSLEISLMLHNPDIPCMLHSLEISLILHSPDMSLPATTNYSSMQKKLPGAQRAAHS